MWTCKCGEQIEDQFDACWKCTGPSLDEAGAHENTELLDIKCPRCRIDLDDLGSKQFYEGEYWRDIVLGDLFINREHFDLYACSRCGHVEFFLKGVGEKRRPKNFVEPTSDEEPTQAV